MDTPKELLDAARQFARQYPDDIDAATAATLDVAKALPTFDQFKDQLIETAIRSFVHAARHEGNVALRAQAGGYGGPAKVKPFDSEAVRRIEQSLYDYAIGRKSLGSLLGEELAEIAASERAIASGHDFNARLCEALAPLVPEGQTVREAVGERKLKAIFKRTGGKPDLLPAMAGH